VAQPQPSVAASNTVPPELEASVNELVMISGKTRDQCVLALRAAQGSPDVAFEILMSGMPLTEAALGGGAGGAEGDYGDEYGEESEEPLGGGAGNPLAAIAQNPNFQLIRQRILQDPSFYNQFMQQLAQT
jgi:hypothetical protein